MHSTARVVKVGVIVLVFAVFIAGGMAANVQAGPLLQATTSATMSATMSATSSVGTSGGASGASVNATMSATTSAGGTAGTSPVFALCPPLNGLPTAVATMSSSGTNNTGSNAAQASNVNTTGTGPGYLGVQVAANDSCGVDILQVFQNSPAMVAGLHTGDIIVAVNCSPLTAMFAMNTTAGGATGTVNNSNNGANAQTGTGGAAGQVNSNSAAATMEASPMATESGAASGSVATQMAALTDCSSAAGGSTGSNAGMSATATSEATQSAGGVSGSNVAQPVSAFVVVSTFFRAIESNPPGTQILLTVDRDGQEMNIPVTLGALPPGVQPFFSGGVATVAPTNTGVAPVAPTSAPANPPAAAPTATTAAPAVTLPATAPATMAP